MPYPAKGRGKRAWRSSASPRLFRHLVLHKRMGARLSASSRGYLVAGSLLLRCTELDVVGSVAVLVGQDVVALALDVAAAVIVLAFSRHAWRCRGCNGECGERGEDEIPHDLSPLSRVKLPDRAGSRSGPPRRRFPLDFYGGL